MSFKSNAKRGAAEAAGAMGVYILVAAVSLAFLIAGYMLYKSGKESGNNSKKITGIVLMVIGVLPALPYVLGGIGVDIGMSLFDD